MVKVQRAPYKLKRLSDVPHNSTRRDQYNKDEDYQDKQKKRSRATYRRKREVDLESCLHSLAFLDKLATNERIRFPSKAVANTQVFTVSATANAMQQWYQTVWRWIKNEQIPAPVLALCSTGALVFHIDEVRVFVEEVGNHEREMAYYRRDHHSVRERIISKIGSIRDSWS